VDRVSLDIRTGEFFSMLGPSGCGKTTTLRMIGGFELPSAGRIELRGRNVTTDPPDKRPVNMVFQNYALFPHLDVAGNIAFGLRRKGVEKAETTRRVAEALELVHLAGYDRRKPNQLSGGQQQRVALARALVNRPNVLLLDEPLGALDLKLRKALQVELKRVQTEVGITFVYVTHDQEEALTMSDRIAVMNRGRVEQLGTPEELYERPRTRFVADFIGTTNLLRGTIEGMDSGCAVVRLESGDRCRVAGVDTVGRTLDLSLRPEAIAIDRPNGAVHAPLDRLGATVEQVAYLGAAVQYRVRTPGGLSMSVLASKVGSRFVRGDDVELAWPPTEALVLDEPTGQKEELP
jgi:spermidine/putrescine transport system ATP-binding protein